jgi:hypothetical protein
MNFTANFTANTIELGHSDKVRDKVCGKVLGKAAIGTVGTDSPRKVQPSAV